MSNLANKIATEHASTSGVGCTCGHYPDRDAPVSADRTRHLIAVIEQAVRAQVAADIRAEAGTEDQFDAGSDMRDIGTWDGMLNAARIAEGSSA